jgi:dTDP-4-amino-4,6-dideoxygalactose transaminase
MNDTMIPFIDLQKQKKHLGERIEHAIQSVLMHGGFIMGPEITELENKLSNFCGAKHSITCSSGTDALALILMAKGIGKGDAVFVPSFTFAATAEVVVWLGATPIFVDVLPDTYNINANSLEQGIACAKNLNLAPKVVISVDLFGNPADYDEIEFICKKYSLWLLSDAAQSFGAVYKNRKVGTIGLATATSFFPAKPLGCYGDGGAIFTDNDELAQIIRSLRVHGQGENKYDNVRIGMNGRLDTIQAAILLEKLAIFKDEIIARQKIAENYNKAFQNHIKIPLINKGSYSVWAQYSVLLNNPESREEIINKLKLQNIPSVVYYPKPLHKQSAFSQYPIAEKQGLPVAEDLAKRILSLPMHPYLEEEQQRYIIETFCTLIS